MYIRDAWIKNGYTGCDHLIDLSDEDEVRCAVIGPEWRSLRDAKRAARRAYEASCDARVRHAPIGMVVVSVRGGPYEVTA